MRAAAWVWSTSCGPTSSRMVASTPWTPMCDLGSRSMAGATTMLRPYCMLSASGRCGCSRTIRRRCAGYARRASRLSGWSRCRRRHTIATWDTCAPRSGRLNHVAPAGEALGTAPSAPPDAIGLLGDVQPRADRPYLVVKYAQSLDGRIATITGDSKWISGEEQRSVSHALRAACDSVMVGVGTVLRDDPRLTVRLVPGASPLRVVLDSTLRIPSTALVLDGDPVTFVFTTDRAAQSDRE